MSDKPITYRAYLTLALMMNEDVAVFGLREAVSSVLLSHPERDPDELKTLDEWRASEPTG